METLIDAVHSRTRLDALLDTGLLDSQVEEEFDRLTRLASRLLHAPATFFSLVDADRDFYKSCFGFAEPLASERQLTGLTFCHYSLVSEGALVIPDTKADPLYATVPTVESLGVAAYLGVPVRSPTNEVLGSFCAIDFVPRDWTPLEIETMKQLAKSAEREVAIRHWIAQQTRLTNSRALLMRGFTHDVKNPLGAADGYLSLMQEAMYGPLTEPMKQTVNQVRRSIGTALKLIDDLITIARAESLELFTARSPVDVAAIVEDVATEYRAQADAQNVRIHITNVQLPPLVLSDDDRIRQILSNLISNALKYAAEGDIDIVTDVIGSEADRYATIAVRDRGAGIEAGDLAVLFEEFTRFEPARADGAGLGLAISQRLAHALGGHIDVQSEKGHGSTFTLKLPVAEHPKQ
jgi:signal transduction histidine kinase